MMTFEEKYALAIAYLEAEERGNQEEVNRLMKQIPFSLERARIAIDGVGYEKAKAAGVNFSEVDELYGDAWHAQ